MSGYRIIDCELHDLYEIAILRRRRLLLNWQDEAGLAHLELVQPDDLETTTAGEFLLVRGVNGARVRIRLDRILHARDPATGEDFPVRPAGSGT
jgi:transcriptional antiterminator Rof (Rho-off)